MADYNTLAHGANLPLDTRGDVQSYTTGDLNTLHIVHVITADRSHFAANQDSWRAVAKDQGVTRRGIILEDGRMVMSDECESIAQLRAVTGLDAKIAEAHATEFEIHTVTDADGKASREVAIMVGEGRTEWHQNGRSIINGLRLVHADPNMHVTVGYQQAYSDAVPLFEGTLGDHQDLDQVLLYTSAAIAQAQAE